MVSRDTNQNKAPSQVLHTNTNILTFKRFMQVNYNNANIVINYDKILTTITLENNIFTSLASWLTHLAEAGFSPANGPHYSGCRCEKKSQTLIAAYFQRMRWKRKGIPLL